VIDEGPLKGVELLSFRQSLDRGYFLPLRFYCQA
jgi:hypothetical protein